MRTVPKVMGGIERIWRSFALKIAALILIFFAVPILLYDQLQAADAEKNQLVMQSVASQGRLIAETLRPSLDHVDGKSMHQVGLAFEHLASAGSKIKLLFRPASETKPEAFYFVASAPAVSAEYLDQERSELIQAGILDRLKTSCNETQPLAVRYINPAGAQEVLTSITPIQATSGCWAVITSSQTAGLLGSSLGQPYWRTPAVQFAAAIYLVMALLVTVLFTQVGRNLRRFGRLARDLRTGQGQRGSFAALNRVPELSSVAEEFDRLVVTLRSSSQALRFAAEETAHAFKTPLGIIAQSLEPLRRSINRDDRRAQRALELIDRSIQRLDGLVSAARRLDQTIAETINPPREPVKLSALVEDVVTEYREAHEPNRARFATRIDQGLVVIGAADLLETAIQNVLDNALSFTPRGGEIEIALRARRGVVELGIADQGPGVAPEHLERIFERFVSIRPKDAGAGAIATEVAALSGPPGAAAPADPADGDATGARKEHFGLGLWLVRRNIEAMGGVVAGENRPEGGFRVIMVLPLARR